MRPSRISIPAPPRRPGRRCDCLDYCGDDPALQSGHADPCASKLAREREIAEISERMALQRDIAAQAARQCLQAGAPLRRLDGCEWLDLSEPAELGQPHADVTRAARYLLLMRLAEHHPAQPQLLRLINPPARAARNTPEGSHP